MEKLLIVGCERMMDRLCVGCSRCIVAVNRYEGEFSRYREQGAELMGLTSCGSCPGTTLVPRLALMTLWNSPLGEEPTRIHLAPCLVNCPHSESIIDKMKERCGIEIIPGTHPYRIEKVFCHP